MAHPHLYSYGDLVQHALEFVRGQRSHQMMGDIFRAIQNSYRDIADSRRWTYYLKRDRLNITDQYSTGTLAYTQSTRVVTGSGTTWASTIDSDYFIRIADRVSRILTRDSNTQLTLDTTWNHGFDVSAGATYTIFKGIYSLPIDFVSLDMPYEGDRLRHGRNLRPGEFLAAEQFGEGSGSPYRYMIFGDPDNLARHAVHTYTPPPSATGNDPIDFVYYRRPRQLVYSGYHATNGVSFCTQGKVQTAASTTIEGNSTTAFETAMAGSYIRISRDDDVPTGIDGLHPFREELKISSVTDSDTLVTTAASGFTASNLGYIISDPVDVDPIMIKPLLAAIRKELAILLDMRSKADHIQVYESLYRAAAMSDASRVYKPREMGDGTQLAPREPGVEPPETTG